jgi:plastocyanin
VGRRPLIAVLAGVLLLGGATISGAAISGTVRLEGAPPVPDRVVSAAQISRDCRAHGEIRTENWKVGTNGAFADVVVWVANPPTNAIVPPVTREITQRGCRYIPHVISARAGDPVFVSNGDDTLHNVRGQPHPPTGRSLFNIGQGMKGIRSEVKFPGPGRYTLGCDIHPWMECWVHVFPHGWHAVTDDAGRFALPALPDGTYELQAWHAGFREPLRRNIEVRDGVAEAALVFSTGR